MNDTSDSKLDRLRSTLLELRQSKSNTSINETIDDDPEVSFTINKTPDIVKTVNKTPESIKTPDSKEPSR